LGPDTPAALIVSLPDLCRWSPGAASPSVHLFPLLQTSLGLRGTLLLTAGVSVLGLALTLVLPEPAGRSLDDMDGSTREVGAPPRRVADQTPAH